MPGYWKIKTKKKQARSQIIKLKFKRTKKPSDLHRKVFLCVGFNRKDDRVMAKIILLIKRKNLLQKC